MNQEKNTIVECLLKYINDHQMDNNDIGSFIESLKVDLLNIRLEKEKGLFVLKRRGGLQRFDPDKLKFNIASVSDSIKQPLNESDMLDIVRIVEKKLKAEHVKVVTSYHILETVLSTMKEEGFTSLSDVYRKYNHYL